MLTDKMKDATKAREEVLKGDQSNEENLDEPELTPRIRKKQTASAGEWQFQFIQVITFP